MHSTSKISDRQAVQIIAPIIPATGKVIEDYIINRSSIRRYRQLLGAKQAAELKANFHPQKPMVLHWDGKLMGDLTGDQNKFDYVVFNGTTAQEG